MTPKFKAITTDGKWVEGFYYYSSRYGTHCIKISIENNDGSFIEEDVKVIPETVCVFTGLHDKNGKEIYSGDILSDGKGENGAVFYTPPQFTVHLKSKNGEEPEIFSLANGKVNVNKLEYTEVVGSIHDHLLINETETCECCGKKFPVSEMRMDEENANWWCEGCLNDMKQ